MTTGVLEILEQQLVQAARRELAAKSAATRRRRRRLLAGGFTAVVMLVAAPLALSVSGVINLWSTTLDDGRTFTVERLTGAAIPESARDSGTRVCQRITSRDAAGEKLMYSLACTPVELPANEMFQGTVSVQGGRLQLVVGVVAGGVSSAELTGSTDLELREVPGSPRLLIATTSDRAPKLTLRGDGGKVLEVRDFGPLLPWNRGAVSPPRPGTVVEPAAAGSDTATVRSAP